MSRLTLLIGLVLLPVILLAQGYIFKNGQLQRLEAEPSSPQLYSQSSDPVFAWLEESANNPCRDWYQKAKRVIFLPLEKFRFAENLMPSDVILSLRSALSDLPNNKYQYFWCTTADLFTPFYSNLTEGKRAPKLVDMNSQHTASWLRMNQIMDYFPSDKERSRLVIKPEQRGIYLYLVPRDTTTVIKLEPIYENTVKFSVLGFANSDKAVGAGLMIRFKSGLSAGVTDAIKRWDNTAENQLQVFLGYDIFSTKNLYLALIAGPAWQAELDDNVFDAFGGIGGLHFDFNFGRVGIFAQGLVNRMFVHQHGKTSAAQIYQDPNDPNTIGVKNDLLRPDKKYWRDPEVLGRIGLTFNLN